MIIGKDKFNKSFTKNYINKNNSINNINHFNNLESMKNTNVLDKNEMRDKSFQILQDRLNKGLISIDEFNKQCNKLNKK